MVFRILSTFEFPEGIVFGFYFPMDEDFAAFLSIKYRFLMLEKLRIFVEMSVGIKVVKTDTNKELKKVIR